MWTGPGAVFGVARNRSSYLAQVVSVARLRLAVVSDSEQYVLLVAVRILICLTSYTV